MESTTARRAQQVLADEARASGLLPCSFTFTPGRERRTIVRYPAGAMIRLGSLAREDGEVAEDMVAGFLAANDRGGDRRLRLELLFALLTAEVI